MVGIVCAGSLILGGGNPRSADKIVVDMLNTLHALLVEKFKATLAHGRS